MMGVVFSFHESKQLTPHLWCGKCWLTDKLFIKLTAGLKGLCHGQKCHLLSDPEVYHEQMGPILSPNGSLDIALSNAHT